MKPHIRTITILASVLAALTIAALISNIAHADPGVIYVDKDAPGPAHNGLSWMTAYTNVQAALSVTVSGDEIWVAEGVYAPGVDPTSTFLLTEGVALYGGFGGHGISETMRTQRNWAAHVTVLSGDIDGNDTTDVHGVVTATNNITGANAYHVVTGDGVTGTAVLDGFTVTAGRANIDSGGGMYNDNSSPTLTNVTFSGNRADDNGGGMYNDYSSPSLANVAFSGNSAGQGGGMANDWFSNPTLMDVTFSRNWAGQGGGGMVNYNTSNPTLTNVIFTGNWTWRAGGGLANGSWRNPRLTNVIFIGNQASWGGGMSNGLGNPTLTSVTFSGNWAWQDGGGMANLSSDGNPTLVNCILWGNVAPTGPQIYNDGSTPAVSYSDVQGTSVYTGTGNINADPQFVEPITATAAPTTTGNYRLRLTSPAIDAGNNLSVTVATDLDGLPRKVDVPGVPDTGKGTAPIVDMGAYEAQMRNLTVAKVGNGSGSVSSVPTGINCGVICTAQYAPGAVVTLTASPVAGSDFAGWSDAVTGMTNPINVTMNTNKAITATFTLPCMVVSGAGFSFVPATPGVGQAVTFFGTVMAGTSPITYTWSFGDGGIGGGAVVMHIFPITEGLQSYTVALTVSNACGTSSVQQAITVWPYTIYLPVVLKS